MTRIVLFLLAACAGLAAGADATTVLIDDFENIGWGSKWVTVGVAGGDLEPTVSHLAAGGHDGKGCARIALGARSALTIRREFGKGFVGNGDKECVVLPGDPTRLGMWIKGNGSTATLKVNVSGQVLEFGTLEKNEWTFVERDLPAIAERPVRLREFAFDASGVEAVATSDVLIDDIVLTTTGTAQQPFFIQFERDGLDHQIADGEPFSARLRLQNLTGEPRPLKINVDVTGNKTAVTSSVETLKSKTIEVELAPGEERTWNFGYAYPAGVYNGYLQLIDARSEQMLADQRIEYAVFPAVAGASRKDFTLTNNGLTPFVAVRNQGPKLRLFQGGSDYGLGRPSRIAFIAGKKPVIVGTDADVALERMSECWMLAWFNGATGWDAIGGTPYPIDVPLLIAFERKPLAMRPAGDGIELSFAAEAGQVQIVPLYGVSHVPADDTAAWAKKLPADVVARCRLFSQVSRALPISVEEKYLIDPQRDVVTVRCRFEFDAIVDDWGTVARTVAPLEPMTALVQRQGGFAALRVQGEVLDLDLAMGQGLWSGVEGVNEYTYTLSGLTAYINQVPQPKVIPEDDPLLAQARANYDVGGALWGRFHNSWWALENLGRAGAAGDYIPYLDAGTQAYAKHSAMALAAFTLNPNNLVFEFDQQRKVAYALDGQNYERMGWCDANATSNEGLRQAYRYTVGTGDRALIKQRWPFLCSYYNVPVRMAHWGDSAFNTGGGDTFGSNLNGTIEFARMAYWVGDEASYTFASYHAAKQLVALYGVCMAYPKWVVEKRMWSTFQGEFQVRQEGKGFAFYAAHVVDGVKTQVLAALEDIQFTDLRGGNIGIVPWCQIQRSSNAQDRFLAQHCAPFQEYMLDGIVKKWRPAYYQAAVAELGAANHEEIRKGESLPAALRDHCNVSLGAFDISAYDFFRGVKPAQRRARMQQSLAANDKLRGREFDVILAGIPEAYAPLWQGGTWTPRADTSFRLGLEKVASGAWNSVLTSATPKFQWPTLGWATVIPPKQPAVNSLGMVPLCGIIPDETKISFAATGENHGWNGSSWNADHLDYPVLTMARELGQLPLHLQSIVIERGLEDAERHVTTLLKQSAIPWNVAGPFPYHNQSDFDAKLPPEDAIDLAADFGAVKIGLDYQAKWSRTTSAMYNVDFNTLFAHNNGDFTDSCQVYTQVWVRSPTARDVQFALGSDDGPKVWVNGALVWKNWVHRGTVWDNDVFPVHLEAGWNSILVKVFNRQHGCGFEQRLRIVDDRLLPIPDLEFCADAPSDDSARRE